MRPSRPRLSAVSHGGQQQPGDHVPQHHRPAPLGHDAHAVGSVLRPRRRRGRPRRGSRSRSSPREPRSRSAPGSSAPGRWPARTRRCAGRVRGQVAVEALAGDPDRQHLALGGRRRARTRSACRRRAGARSGPGARSSVAGTTATPGATAVEARERLRPPHPPGSVGRHQRGGGQQRVGPHRQIGRPAASRRAARARSRPARPSARSTITPQSGTRRPNGRNTGSPSS